MTIEKHWQEYLKCYPTQVSATQLKEMHQCFFSGALVVLAMMQELAELPEEQADKALESIMSEAVAVGEAIIIRNRQNRS